MVVRVLPMRLPAGTARNDSKAACDQDPGVEIRNPFGHIQQTAMTALCATIVDALSTGSLDGGTGGRSSMHRGPDRQTTVVVAAQIREQIRLASDHAMPLLGISFFAVCRNVRS